MGAPVGAVGAIVGATESASVGVVCGSKILVESLLFRVLWE